MSVKSSYVRAWAVETGAFAVWQPGDPVAVGDYGLTVHGEFEKLGNIADFRIRFRCDTTNRADLVLTSEGVTTEMAGSSAELGLPSLAGARASLKVKFGRADSIYVRANGVMLTALANLRDLVGELQENGQWDFGWRLVTEVRRCASLVVLVATRANASVVIQGDLPAIEQFQLGKASANLNVALNKDGAFSYVGSDSPFLMDLVRIRRFPLWRSAVKYSVGEGLEEPAEPYKRLNALEEIGQHELS